MNWYRYITKVAFPYGRVTCPSCKKIYANDFGFKDVASGANTSTQDVQNGNLPFIQYEKTKYDDPINTGDDSSISQDEIERGTITSECPHCKQWALLVYEWNTANVHSKDFFSQAVIIDIEPISEEMARNYQISGVTSSFATSDI